MGYLPQAMANYLALLGWGDGNENEFFTTDDLGLFSIFFFLSCKMLLLLLSFIIFVIVIFHGCRILMGLVINFLLYENFLHCSSFYVKEVHYFYNFVLC
jgi:hypothetical protein